MNLDSGDPQTRQTFRDRHLQDLTEHVWAEFTLGSVHPNEIDEVEAPFHAWDLHEFPCNNLSGGRLHVERTADTKMCNIFSNQQFYRWGCRTRATRCG